MPHFLKKLFSKSFKNFRRILLVCALILAVILIISALRSCNGHHIIHKQVYVVARDSSFYTMPLLGRERNLLAFTNDLMVAIAQQTGLRFAWLESNPGTLFDSLDSGTSDLILSPMSPNNFNLDKYVFSEPIFKIGPVLILPKNSSISNLKQMKGLTLGISYGTSTKFNAIRQSGAHAYELIFVTFYDTAKASEALTNNRIDGIIMNAIPAYTLRSGIYNESLKIASKPLTDDGLRFIGLRNATAEMLISDVNNALRTIRENGTYDTLIEKWHLFDADKDFTP